MEADLRAAVKQQLLHDEIRDPRALVIDELGIRNGSVRVDLAVINGIIHGFELKSAADTLYRLPRQIRGYGGVLDRATLVAADLHVEEADEILPPWWGLVAASGESPAEMSFENVRLPAPNPNLNPFDIARLLWRNEAIEVLEKLGAADGICSKPRAAVQARLAESLDIDVLRYTVRRCLRHREDWRPVARQESGGD